MGLDVSHGAWTGAYSAFNRFRQAVCQALGGSFPPHNPHDAKAKKLEPDYWYWGPEANPEEWPGLAIFLAHSDCDGEISAEDAANIANELERLLPKIEALPIGAGHIQRDGGIRKVTLRFIEGCRAAAKAGQPLEFY